MATATETVKATRLDRFDGGWNPRDALGQVAANETPDCMNVTLDQRGGAVKRLGNSKLNLSALAGNAKQGFEWRSAGKLVVQIGTDVYVSSDLATFTEIHTFTTDARAGFCDFNGELVCCHPVDGTATWDGTTWTVRAASVLGSTCTVWQNKVWVSGVTSRVWWCNAGDVHTWTTATDFVDVRDVSDLPVTCLGAGQGEDILGRPTLYAWKDGSLHRINDSTTGAYTTIDSSHGAAGPNAVASLYGVTAALGRDGIFKVVGDTLVPVAAKLAPLFRTSELNLAAFSGVAAGIGQDRIFFSLPLAGSSVNSLELEYHPLEGWIVPHDFAAAWYAAWTKDDAELFKGHPSNAYLYKAFSGGADDGAAIGCRFQTAWVQPYDGYRASFHRCRILGRGSNVSAYTLLEFETGQGELQSYSIDLGGFTWNQFHWNDGSVWGPSTYQEYYDLPLRDAGKAISLVFSESSTATSSGPQVLDQGASPTEGPFALYELLFEHTQRGRS